MCRKIVSAAAVTVLCVVSAAPALSETRAHNGIGRFEIPKTYLTASEVREISLKIGVPLEIGYAFVGGNTRTPIQITSQPKNFDDGTATPQIASQSMASNHIPINDNVINSSSRRSPSLVDLSQLPPGYVPPPYQPDPGAYSSKLEARSFKIFGYSREEERQRWMAEQEEREIADQINASKPLLFPVSSH
jgi:hypothetical protein